MVTITRAYAVSFRFKKSFMIYHLYDVFNMINLFMSIRSNVKKAGLNDSEIELILGIIFSCNIKHYNIID